MKVCIDAGHGGNDSGAVGVNGRLEKNDNLKLALALDAELRARGHNVLMTRIGDVYPSLDERAKKANDWGADVFVSLHRNSYTDAKANGSEVLYGTNASRTSIKLAETVNEKINTAAGFTNRGAKRQGATVLNKTKMPAITIEAGFITNALDNSKFDSFFVKIVKAIADGIEESFGIEPMETDPFAYEINGAAPLWRYVGEGKKGTVVTLDAYPIAPEPAGVFARIKDENGAQYLCEWKYLKKI